MSSSNIQPADGRVGVLTVGLGAVATTFIAGVEAVRRGVGQPIGSLTQLGHIRLGKRTENRNPKISELVPLAGLDQLVFGAWDPIPDNAYEAAVNAGVLEAKHLDPVKDFLTAIKPMPAVFDQNYCRNIDGDNVKKGKNKRDLAEQLRADMRDFKARHKCDRMIVIWCGSTEVFLQPSEIHQT